MSRWLREARDGGRGGYEAVVDGGYEGKLKYVAVCCCPCNLIQGPDYSSEAASCTSCMNAPSACARLQTFAPAHAHMHEPTRLPLSLPLYVPAAASTPFTRSLHTPGVSRAPGLPWVLTSWGTTKAQDREWPMTAMGMVRAAVLWPVGVTRQVFLANGDGVVMVRRCKSAPSQPVIP